jgi:hypothetical protein
MRRGSVSGWCQDLTHAAQDYVQRWRYDSRSATQEPTLSNLGIRRLDHLSPCIDFRFDAIGKFLGRARDHLVTKRRQTLLHVRLRNDLDDFTMEQGHIAVTRLDQTDRFE